MKKNIVKDLKLKTSFLKNEYKKVLYKSIMHSALTKKLTKKLIKYKLSMWKIKYRVSFQRRVCILLGKNRSVYPKLNLKRHTIKKMNATNLITGLGTAKW